MANTIGKKELYLTKISLEDLRINPDLQLYYGNIILVENGKAIAEYRTFTDFFLSSTYGHRQIKTMVITPTTNGAISIYINLEE